MIIDQAFALAVQGLVVQAAALAHQGLDDSSLPAHEPARVQLQAAAEAFDALCDMTRGRYSAALQRIGAPMAVLESGPHRRELAYAASCIGFTLGKLGDPQSGLAWVARATALAQATGRAVESIRALNDEGCLHAMLDRHERGIACLTDAATQALKSAPRFGQAACLGNLAFAWLLHAQRLQEQGAAGDAAAAAESAAGWADRAFAAADWSKAWPHLAWSRAVRGRAALLQGRDEPAAADLAQALEWAGDYPQVRVEVLRGLMALHVQRGQTELARSQLTAALALCDGENYLPVRLALLQDAVQLESAAGRPDQALAWWLQHFEGLQRQFVSRQAVQASGGLMSPAATPVWPAPQRDVAAEQVDWMDEQTSLLNWRGLERVGQLAFAGPRALTVAVLRIDGLSAPLAAQVQVAAHLAGAWCPGFVAGRGLGNSFLLLFPELPVRQAGALCENLRAALEQADNIERTTLSVGMATQGPAHADLQALMGDALQALGAGIRAGGNLVVRPS